MKVNQELLKGLGNAGLKIGKQIVIDGTKAVVLKSTTAVISGAFEEGLAGVKNLKLDDYLAGKKLKKKVEETVEVVEKVEITEE